MEVLVEAEQYSEESNCECRDCDHCRCDTDSCLCDGKNR